MAINWQTGAISGDYDVGASKDTGQDDEDMEGKKKAMSALMDMLQSGGSSQASGGGPDSEQMPEEVKPTTGLFDQGETEYLKAKKKGKSGGGGGGGGGMGGMGSMMGGGGSGGGGGMGGMMGGM